MWPLNKNNKNTTTQTALILAGGGARAAYQVGVIKAISDILPRKSTNPFDVISGTSAGAINAAVLATRADSFYYAASSMTHVWRNFSTEQIYNAAIKDILGNVWRMSRAIRGNDIDEANALLDNSPLRELLHKVIPLDNIQMAIDNGFLKALCINASEYGTGQSVSFFQGTKDLKEWGRSGRRGEAEAISLDHLMSSSAIPFLFPAQKVNGNYYCDGAVRQTAPISPALHLGANKIMVIGVKGREIEKRTSPLSQAPSLSNSAGHILNSVFLDSMESDIERLYRINNTIDLIPQSKREQSDLKKVDLLVIEPSKPIDEIASHHWQELPKALRYAFGKNTKDDEKHSIMLSYLLFEKDYCRELIGLGHQDAMRQADKISKFFSHKRL